MSDQIPPKEPTQSTPPSALERTRPTVRRTTKAEVFRETSRRRRTQFVGTRRKSRFLHWIAHPRFLTALGFTAVCAHLYLRFNEHFGDGRIGAPYAGKSVANLFRNAQGELVWSWHVPPMHALAMVFMAVCLLLATCLRSAVWRRRLAATACVTGILLLPHLMRSEMTFGWAVGTGLTVGALLVPRKERTNTATLALAVGTTLLALFLFAPHPAQRNAEGEITSQTYQCTALTAFDQFRAPAPSAVQVESTEDENTPNDESPASTDSEGSQKTPKEPSRIGQIWEALGATFKILLTLLIFLIALLSWCRVEGAFLRWAAAAAMVAYILMTSIDVYSSHLTTLDQQIRVLTPTQHGLAMVSEYWTRSFVPMVAPLAAVVALLGTRWGHGGKGTFEIAD